MSSSLIGAHCRPLNARSNICIYAANDFTSFHKFMPLLIDRLGMPGGGGSNRLILAASLDDPDNPPLLPQLPPEGLPLFDWLVPLYPTNNGAGSTARDEGGNNAVTI
jgi:hypothetical protein